MGFREDIRVDHLFRAALGEDPVVGPLPVEVRFPSPREEVLFAEPLRTGGGPSSRSTSMELEPWPSVVWDVNGYYHALGVGFRATRRQLRTAYYQVNGEKSEYLTYVLKQLLNSETRREYDSYPLGSVFFDKYTEEKLKRRAKEVAAQMGWDPSDLLECWGFEVERPHEEAEVEVEERVDIPQETREDDPTASPPRPQAEGWESLPLQEVEEWPYSYFLWKLQPRHSALDFGSIMRRWQEAIASECLARRASVKFAVGLTSGDNKDDQSFFVMSVKGATVAFISAGHIDRVEELAPHAAQWLIHLRD